MEGFVAEVPTVDVWTLTEEERQVHWNKYEDELKRIWAMPTEELAKEYYNDFIKAIEKCSLERQEELKEKYALASAELVKLPKKHLIQAIPGHFPNGDFHVVMLPVCVDW